jgi:hypothetical protein
MTGAQIRILALLLNFSIWGAFYLLWVALS